MDSTIRVDTATENIQNAVLSKPDKFFVSNLDKRYYETFTFQRKIKIRC